jgi:hypothetical protein
LLTKNHNKTACEYLYWAIVANRYIIIYFASCSDLGKP